jgi:hypothetical protein
MYFPYTKMIHNFNNWKSLILESLASDVDNKISAALKGSIDAQAKERAKTYLNLDLDQTIKKESEVLKKLLETYLTKINNISFDPLTLPKVAGEFETDLISALGKELDVIKSKLPLTTKAALSLKKGDWKADFLKTNSDKDSPVTKAVDAVVEVLDKQEVRGEQVIKGGKATKPFKLKFGTEWRTYGDSDVGVFTGNHVEAFVDILNYNKPKIAKSIVSTIAEKVFA